MTALDRRDVLMLAASALTLAGAGTASASDVCFDLAKLPSSDAGLRKSLNFKAKTPDPDRACGKCAFFASAGGSCGKCALLSGGPVANDSVCDSFAKKG